MSDATDEGDEIEERDEIEEGDEIGGGNEFEKGDGIGEGDATDEAIVRRRFDTDEDPTTSVAETVADLEERDATDLPTLYGCIDHVLDHLFSNPPSPEAGAQVSFTYENYRITVDQDGTARFVDVGESSA